MTHELPPPPPQEPLPLRPQVPNKIPELSVLNGSEIRQGLEEVEEKAFTSDVLDGVVIGQGESYIIGIPYELVGHEGLLVAHLTVTGGVGEDEYTFESGTEAVENVEDAVLTWLSDGQQPRARFGSAEFTDTPADITRAIAYVRTAFAYNATLINAEIDKPDQDGS